MQNLKYLIGGTMVGGAFGAKAGEYLAVVSSEVNSFAWIESAMFIGAVAGLIIAAAIVSVLRTERSQKESETSYKQIRQEHSVTSSQELKSLTN